ncbi:nitrile hydratase subunit alpha [Acuticoccus sediminis]|uniref:nitrile hydratase subunit alpha n=1 Tax=Acuticoccus sediminis TaxID=2184697 RepID=UPI001CFE10DE|nr:nitrile hydratase subunit alpha [Acuticoccus sediminis]
MDDQFKYPPNREAQSAARVRALEALLIEKGVITDKTVDTVLGYFETKMGPFNGAKIVARAWVDPDFKARLVADTPAAIAELGLGEGMAGAEGEHMRAVANAPGVHNLIICTLCSCYPWPVLGLPPYWYKDPTFRSRAAREPRAVLEEFGLGISTDIEVKVWDSSAQIRWFVVPERPAGTEGLSEAELAALVSPESMMGVALVQPAA